MKLLKEKINKLKELLENKLKDNNYMSNDDVVKISQDLDKYIVMYQKISKNKKVV